MREIGLISCTKTKRKNPAQPRELYDPSSLFSKARKYCEQNHDDWYILSAKHHLLDPHGSAIKPYDETLTDARVSEKREWSNKVFEQLESAGLTNSNTVLIFHAGKAYYEELLPLLEDTEATVRLPVEGLMIGERLGWYNDRI